MKMKLANSKPSLEVLFWPDGTSVAADDYRENDYVHMSDDFTRIDLYDFAAMNAYPDRVLILRLVEEYIGEDPLASHE